MLGSLPLLALVIIVYNIVVYLTGFTMDSTILEVKLVSGTTWIISLGDVLLMVALLLLFLELVNSTKTGTSTIINHSLSMLVLLVGLVEFVVLPPFGTSVFFLIVVLALLDVIAGFTVTITAARRDLNI